MMISRKCAESWLRAVVLLSPLGLLLLLALLWWALRDYEVVGPRSPQGISPVAQVRDAGISWSADFYCDVELHSLSGTRLCRWSDPDGRESRGGVNTLVESMRWISANEFCFDDDGAVVRMVRSGDDDTWRVAEEK